MPDIVRSQSEREESSVKLPRVLIVETDPFTRQLASYFLEEAGYEVNFADDGYTALDRVRLDQPDLIIADIMLPHLDGLALCRLLKEDPVTSAVPILIYTVLNSEARALASGANAFLKKPIEKTLLLKIVNSLIPSKSPPENV